jgi:RIO kinase 1
VPAHEPDRAAPAWLTEAATVEQVLGLLKTGKEAEVFLVERSTPDRARSAVLAHKRYRPTHVSYKGELEGLGFSRARTFVDDARYREGHTFGSSRDRRAVRRKSARGRQVLAARWPDQEFESLVRAHDAGVSVPYPVERTADGVLMQFVGEGATAAPRLVSAGLDGDALAAAYAQLMGDVATLTRAGLVHADLSPYNLLWWHDRVWMIDFPQAVDLALNPHAVDMLHHDVTTVCTWFVRRGVDCDGEEVFAGLLAELW